MLEWIKKHKGTFMLACISVLFLLIGVPLIINILFKTYSSIEIFQAEWSAGDALGYYGAVLSFVGTVVLGALALYQNHVIKADADKKAALLEERVHRENMPRFRFGLRGANGFCGKLDLAINNISQNSAYEICVFDVRLKCGATTIWEDSRVHNYHSIDAQKEIVFHIEPQSKETKAEIVLSGIMTCKDKYDEKHEYLFRMNCRYPNKYEDATMIELRKN